uniref:Acyl-protein thioesterase 1 n=1 Tax=Talaromyces marneffei PM1 TaxID=1077442 RepID=A0A093V817_TALMA
MSNSVYPPRHVYFPEGDHETTVIFLHDRNSTGPELADYFARSADTSGKSLYNHFPSTRWVFPSARAGHFYWTQADRRQLSQSKKDSITEWFELGSLENVQLESPGQLTTLQESATYILRIIDDEIARIKRVGGSSQKIFLAGIGQGAALGLVVLLCTHHELGGFVGMDGWMPFAETLSNLLEQNQIDEAGGFIKLRFIGVAQQAYIQQQKQQQAWAAYNASAAHLSPPSAQPANQPTETEVVASKVVVPAHVKTMGIILGHSQGSSQLGKPELGARAVSVLKQIGFSRISWKPELEHLDEGGEASGHDSTAVFPFGNPGQVEQIVRFFKDLGLAG